MSADAVIAAWSAAGLSAEQRALAAFDVIDALPDREGALRALERRSWEPEILRYARPQAHAPLIIGHRGDPTLFVENTLPGIRSAFEQQADAVEIDVTLVRQDEGDGYEIIARHDPEPGRLSVSAVYALIRNLGLEPWVYADDLFLARPTTPPIWRRSRRRPSWDLTLSSYRADYGYTNVKAWPMLGVPLEAEIPTLGQIAQMVGQEFRDKILFLDTKLPAGRPDLWRAMAERIGTAVAEHHLEAGRLILGSGDATILGALRDILGRDYRYSLDEYIIGPFAKAAGHSPHARATAFDTDIGDVGHVFFGSDSELLAVVARDAPLMHRDRKQLIVWTINSELMFRKLLGVGGRQGGGVHMVITDRPAQFRQRLEAMGLRAPAPAGIDGAPARAFDAPPNSTG